jgi:hypothetical protein
MVNNKAAQNTNNFDNLRKSPSATSRSTNEQNYALQKVLDKAKERSQSIEVPAKTSRN